MSETIIPVENEDFMALLYRCGGWYESPRKADGVWAGPLVGYAERDERGRQLVGYHYANFAMAEEHGPVLRHCAVRLELKAASVPNLIDGSFTGFIGAPEGGKALAAVLATLTSQRYIFPEKKVTKAATPEGKEVSHLVWGRHGPAPGTSWVIVEDVCHNFSTASQLVELAKRRDARVVGIACFLNCSTEVDRQYIHRANACRSEDLPLPLIALVRHPYSQYSQDAPEVQNHLATGQVAWNPKKEWPRLQSAMADGSL